MPPSRQGLGNHHCLLHRMGNDRFHPHAHPQNCKVLLCLVIFRVRHVDKARGSFRLSPDFCLLRHLSSFVKPGAHYIPTSSFVGYENQMAFRNRDGSLVLILNNEMSEPLTVGLAIGELQVTPTLPPDSFNSIHIPADLLKTQSQVSP
ncbi:glycoside hydrolase family 30 beta sandwich domain-containing protein [Novosphingobium rosa]|uniref:glycoside hydrolase family 30 beta sandwich domain-containing protein n=1 Tax=Novosphingobium rosa TaxID=76978 RepID=UPI0012EE1946